ncbi:MAG: hypothetical protein AB7V46_02570 [Thermomicrobiales bacterium]
MVVVGADVVEVVVEVVVDVVVEVVVGSGVVDVVVDVVEVVVGSAVVDVVVEVVVEVVVVVVVIAQKLSTHVRPSQQGLFSPQSTPSSLHVGPVVAAQRFSTQLFVQHPPFPLQH